MLCNMVEHNKLYLKIHDVISRENSAAFIVYTPDESNGLTKKPELIAATSSDYDETRI